MSINCRVYSNWATCAMLSVNDASIWLAVQEKCADGTSLFRRFTGVSTIPLLTGQSVSRQRRAVNMFPWSRKLKRHRYDFDYPGHYPNAIIPNPIAIPKSPHLGPPRHAPPPPVIIRSKPKPKSKSKSKSFLPFLQCLHIHVHTPKSKSKSKSKSKRSRWWYPSSSSSSSYWPHKYKKSRSKKKYWSSSTDSDDYYDYYYDRPRSKSRSRSYKKSSRRVRFAPVDSDSLRRYSYTSNYRPHYRSGYSTDSSSTGDYYYPSKPRRSSSRWYSPSYW